MEFSIDTADLQQIEWCMDHLPITGVTSNPSIVKKAAPKDFFAHMRAIRALIGKDHPFHIQITADNAQGMVEEAHRIFEEIDDQVYIKIPVTPEGLKAMKALKKEGRNVTATCVYDLMQGYLALEAGADYIAPYFSRIGNLGGDPRDLIRSLSGRIREDGYDCRILAASFKSEGQVKEALQAGAQSVTVNPEILVQVFANPSIDKAVKDFRSDWESLYGEGTEMTDL